MAAFALLAVLIVVVDSCWAQQESILSATYGVAGCIGVKDTSDWADLTMRGCNVVTISTAQGPKNVTSARSTLNMKGVCGLLSNILHMDGLPITFSSPVVASTLDASDFNFTLSDGTWVQPVCATLKPADEENEGHTVATVGRFGDGLKGTVYPISITIVGELSLKTLNGTVVSARGLTFSSGPDFPYMSPTSHPKMVLAWVERFSTAGETLSSATRKGVFPNHCQQIFGAGVTHRVRVVLSGGGTIDGVTSFQPHTPEVLQLYLQNGSQLEAPYVLGFADLGMSTAGDATYAHDNDNYIDICLSDPNLQAVNALAAVRLPCTSTKLYYPKGAKYWSGCQDHSVSVRGA